MSSKPSTSANVTLVLGIIGTVSWIVLSAFSSLVLGIVGLVYWHKAEVGGKRTAGLVLGIVNTALGGLGSVFVTVLLAGL